jgi:hypothetical protein
LVLHVPALEVDVDGAESFAVLVGLVNRVDAVNESDIQLSECSENGALGLFSADGRKGSGNAYTERRPFIATAVITVITGIARNVSLFVVLSGTTAVITGITDITRNIALFVVLSGTTAVITGITGITGIVS